MRRRFFILAIVFLAIFPLPAFCQVIFSENFEYGVTSTNAGIDTNSTTVLLTPDTSVIQWVDSNGLGILECDNPARRDYFTYRKRIGNTLIGVSGVDFSHPEGVDVRTNGKLQWNSFPPLFPGQNDSSSAICEGFGLRFFRGCPFIEKRIPATDHIAVRFYLTIASYLDSTASPSKVIGIHELLPEKNVAMQIRYMNEKEALLQFRFQPYGTLLSVIIPFDQAICVEYDLNYLRQTHAYALSIWIDGRNSFQKVLAVNPDVTIAQVFGFRFLYSNDPLHYLYADFKIDDIACGNARIGPRSASPAIRIIPLMGGIFDVLPDDTLSIEDMEFRLSYDGTARFPYFSQHIGPGAGLRYHFRYIYFPLEKLTLPSRVKRIGEDWSIWNNSYVTLPDTVLAKNRDWSVWSVGLKHPDASVQKRRPVVDSIVITREGDTKAVDTLFRDTWYNLYFYMSDPQGFDNLFYNYIILSHSKNTDGNPLDRGGNFDPRGCYFISLSKDEKLVYVKDTPGYSNGTPLCPTCTSYVNGAKDSYVIDQRKRSWKTNFRLFPQAESRLWMLQGTVFNHQEIPSISVRKKIMTVEGLSVSSSWFFRVFFIGIPAAMVVLCLCIFLFKRKNEVAVKINDKNLDFRVKIVFELIAKRFTEDLSLNDIAAAANANPVWLSTTFKEQTGVAIFNYINKLRCNKAMEYLKENQLNISQIGYKLGFNSPAYFKQVFKKHTGISPSQFRKEYFLNESPE